MKNDGNLRYGDRLYVRLSDGVVFFARDTAEKAPAKTVQYYNEQGLPLGFTSTPDFETVEMTLVCVAGRQISVGDRFRAVDQDLAVKDGSKIFLVTDVEVSKQELNLTSFNVGMLEQVFASNEPTVVGSTLSITNGIFESGSITLTASTDVDENKLVTIHIPALDPAFVTQVSNSFYIVFEGQPSLEYFSGDVDPMHAGGGIEYRGRFYTYYRFKLYSDGPVFDDLDVVMKYTGDEDGLIIAGTASISTGGEIKASDDPYGIFDIVRTYPGSAVSFGGDNYPYQSGPYKITF